MKIDYTIIKTLIENKSPIVAIHFDKFEKYSLNRPILGFTNPEYFKVDYLSQEITPIVYNGTSFAISIIPVNKNDSLNCNRASSIDDAIIVNGPICDSSNLNTRQKGFDKYELNFISIAIQSD